LLKLEVLSDPARKKQHDQYGHQAFDLSSGFKGGMAYGQYG
jgi:DnaJ-class molecular chaperone